MLWVNDDGRYRVVDEELTLRSLVHHCWPYELWARGMAAAAVETEAREALDRWVSWGLAFAWDGKTRRFDFNEVLNFMSWAGRTRDDPVLIHGPVKTFRRAVTDLSGDDPRPGAGRDRQEFANFTVSLRREFHRQSASVGSSTRFRVPLPLEGANLRDLDVVLIEPDPTVTKFALSLGRLEIRDLFHGTSGPVAIEVRVRFAARPQTCVVDPAKLDNWDRADPDYVLYTNRHEGLIQVTDWVVQTAEQLAKGTHDAWAAVQAFWSFFLQRLSSGRVHHDELDAIDPLRAFGRARLVRLFHRLGALRRPLPRPRHTGPDCQRLHALRRHSQQSLLGRNSPAAFWLGAGRYGELGPGGGECP